jgi:RNA polymerase sigma-54 factor
MSQGLYLSQKMTLTQVLSPQLQHSLALLQAPTLELKALVEQELQQNPILEEISDESQEQEKTQDDAEQAVPSLDLAEPPPDVQFDPATEKPSEAPVDDLQAELERLGQMDQEWRDYFSQGNLPGRSGEEDEEKRQFMLDSLTTGISLQESLLEQMRTSDMPEAWYPIGELIIGNIDDFGYLKATPEELSASGGVPADQILEVLKTIQTFHPAGVGARDLRECLLLQLERGDRKDTLEYQIIDRHFEALGKRRIPEISRATEADLDSVQEALARIARLNPRPGRDFLPDKDIYVLPEIFVTKSGDEYVVSTNDDHIPRLRISNTYKDLMAKANSSPEVRDYIRDKIRAGKFLIKSLNLRQQTIVSIAREIVLRQREFLDKGVAFLKPLTMSQVAAVVGVHETTVSRAVSGKYIETPQGIFEMKYFFTSGIQTATGQGMSNTSVKEMVAEIFQKEDVTKPLSDEEVAQMLKEKGLVIARRTVAKYRGELNILPSNLRKTY